MGCVTTPSRSFFSYGLIDPTFIFEVTAFKSTRNLEKTKAKKHHVAGTHAGKLRALGRSRRDMSGTGSRPKSAPDCLKIRSQLDLKFSLPLTARSPSNLRANPYPEVTDLICRLPLRNFF